MVPTSYLILGYLMHAVDEETENIYIDVIKAIEDVNMPEILPAAVWNSFTELLGHDSQN